MHVILGYQGLVEALNKIEKLSDKEYICHRCRISCAPRKFKEPGHALQLTQVLVESDSLLVVTTIHIHHQIIDRILFKVSPPTLRPCCLLCGLYWFMGSQDFL